MKAMSRVEAVVELNRQAHLSKRTRNSERLAHAALDALGLTPEEQAVVGPACELFYPDRPLK